MGGHLLVTQPANMTRILLLSMVASGMAMSTRQEIQMDMEKFNNDAMCWGVENMMYYRLAQYQAMEECSKYGQFSTLPAPANNPFTTLPGDAKNPWMNVPQPVDSRRNPLAKLFNRNSNTTPTSGPTCGLTSLTEGARGKLRREDSLRLTKLPSSRSSLPTTTSSRRTLGR